MRKQQPLLKGQNFAERIIHDAKQGASGLSGDIVSQYQNAVDPGARAVQEALVNLLGKDSTGMFDSRRYLGAPRMAGNEAVLNLLRSLPAAAVVGGGVAAGDLIAGEESFANKGMDILGMGAGAYGINRGVGGLGGTTPAARALAVAAGLGIGKFGSDAVQGGIGGIM